MFRSHVKIALRQFFRNRTTSLINLFGLTIGLSAAMLIGLYVFGEWRTDRALPHPDRTFRLLRVSQINNEPYDIAITSAPFAPALELDFPGEIEETVRVLDGSSLVTLGEARFQEEKYYYADPNFFAFFGFPLLYGDPATVLSRPHSLVLSRATARRYFGDERKAVGRTLRIDNDYPATVTGVFDEAPATTHLDFDLVESTLALEETDWWQGWWNNNLCTYLRLRPGVSASALGGRLPGFMDKYFARDFERNGHRVGLRLQPLHDVYFEAGTRYDPMRHGDRRATYIFFFAGLLLLVIACANYVNLATARAVGRGREVGIYKVLGSGRGRIVRLMLAESLILSAVAVLLAAQLTALALPWFEQAFGVILRIDFPFWGTAGILAALALAVALAAGWYPGWFLSSFRPVAVLSGNTTTGARHISVLRNALVVVQFVLSVGLLCSTVIVRQQLAFLREKNLGFDREHILLFDINSPELYNKREAFREQLLREPGVRQVSFLNGVPGGFHDASTVEAPELSQTLRMRTAFVDFAFAETFGLQLVAGRQFDARLASDSSHAALLNERAVADLGLTPETALGKKIRLTMFDSLPRVVVGVVRDYHFSSLHEAIEPLVLATAFWGGNVAVKARGDRLPAVITAAEDAWNAFSPAFPFTYQFLDERLDRLYQSETRQGRIFGLFAAIAIGIACLGMFGLAAFAASVRTREIGIRKVLGASVAGIVALLSKDFLKLVAVALVIASPLAWCLMEQWLRDFAYRVDIQWWVFVLVGATAVAVAGLTIGCQSLRAALADPVEALKRE